MSEKIYADKISSIVTLIEAIEKLDPSKREKEGSIITLRRVEKELQDLCMGIEGTRAQEENPTKSTEEEG